MAKSKGVTVLEPRDEPKDRSRLSLKQLDDLIQGHLTRLAEAQDSLHSSLACFRSKGEDILPVQCKRAIASLEELNKYVQQFYELFHETRKLPVIYTALRYRLMSVLYLIEEQSCELTDLIDDYREVCMTSTRDAKQQRWEISDAYTVLLQSIDNIFQRASFLSNEAQFQEHQLTSGHEEKLSADANSENNASVDKLHIVKQHESEIESPEEVKSSRNEKGATGNILHLRSSSREGCLLYLEMAIKNKCAKEEEM